MQRRFSGWTQQALEVLLRLDGEPSQAVRQECRTDRENLVRQPMIDLCQDLADMAPVYEHFHVWDLHKSLWLWQHQYAEINLDRRVSVGLMFDLDGLVVDGGWARADPGQVEQFRRAIACDEDGKALAQIVATLKDQGFSIDGDRMKRPPRGWPPDHPYRELVRFRTLVARRSIGGDLLHRPELFDHVRQALQEVRPLTGWLSAHVVAGNNP